LAAGIGLLPILLKKPGPKKWAVIHASNAVASQLMDGYLVKTKRLEYPVRFFPKVLNTEFVYDYLLCPLITVLYCQSTYNASLLNIAAQGLLFAIPQTAIEYAAEKNTKIVKYKKGWTWVHSFVGIVATKYLFRGLFELIKPEDDIVSNENS
jgi:hypothetical protein